MNGKPLKNEVLWFTKSARHTVFFILCQAWTYSIALPITLPANKRAGQTGSMGDRLPIFVRYTSHAMKAIQQTPWTVRVEMMVALSQASTSPPC